MERAWINIRFLPFAGETLLLALALGALGDRRLARLDGVDGFGPARNGSGPASRNERFADGDDAQYGRSVEDRVGRRDVRIGRCLGPRGRLATDVFGPRLMPLLSAILVAYAVAAAGPAPTAFPLRR
jgi:hypothetical protein